MGRFRMLYDMRLKPIIPNGSVPFLCRWVVLWMLLRVTKCLTRSKYVGFRLTAEVGRGKKRFQYSRYYKNAQMAQKLSSREGGRKGRVGGGEG